MGKINAYIVKKLQEGNKYVPSRNSFPRIRSPSLLENLSHVYDFKEHGEQSDLTKKRPLLASPRGENRTNLFPKGQWYFILVALNLKGRRGRRIEAKRKAAPVPHLHSHLCPCIFISWWREREKLEGSFFCYFPVEEGSVLPIPFRIQPAK